MTEDLRFEIILLRLHAQKVTKIEKSVLDGSLLEVENMSITTYMLISF